MTFWFEIKLGISRCKNNNMGNECWIQCCRDDITLSTRLCAERSEAPEVLDHVPRQFV